MVAQAILGAIASAVLSGTWNRVKAKPTPVRSFGWTTWARRRLR